MKHKLLVTGGSGFVGTPVLDKIIRSQKYEVHITAYSEADKIVEDNIHQHRVNLLNAEDTNKLLMDNKFDALIHLAWYVGPKCQTSSLNIDWLMASLNLVKKFYENGGKKVLIAGSMSEYNFDAGLCKEDVTPLNSLSLYGQSKAALYQTISKFAQFNNIDFKWARLFNLYGQNEKSVRLIPYAILSMLKNQEVNVSSCTQVLNYLHVDDAADAIIKIFESEEQGAFNVCADEALELKCILEKIKQLINYKKNINYGAVPASFEQQFVSGDNSKLTNIGWIQRISLEKGLQHTIEWWKNKENL